MKKILFKLFFLCIVFASCNAQSQQPFADEIKAFAKMDSVAAPVKGSIVFTGSSSFRMWKTLSKDFEGYPVLNRGFGGSRFPDVIHYVEETVLRYNPKQVLIYCGDNDLASADSVTSTVVAQRFKDLFALIRNRLPNTFISFVAIKPSPSRSRLLPEIIKSNQLISAFIATQKNASYIDVFTPMLDKDGKPRPELFIKDMLHMNADGYAIWKKTIAPYLLKD